MAVFDTHQYTVYCNIFSWMVGGLSQLRSVSVTVQCVKFNISYSKMNKTWTHILVLRKPGTFYLQFNWIESKPSVEYVHSQHKSIVRHVQTQRLITVTPPPDCFCAVILTWSGTALGRAQTWIRRTEGTDSLAFRVKVSPVGTGQGPSTWGSCQNETSVGQTH